jgi:tetratricopeptide (TPR) repeat protein
MTDIPPELPATPTGSALSVPDLPTRLDRLVTVLERAHPDKPKRWLDKAYDKVAFGAKYIGIPGLVLAAILPTYNLVNDLIEYRNNQYLSRTYSDFAARLLERNELERASAILADLSSGTHKSVEHRYLQAKILAKVALYQSRRQVEAEDRIALLLEIHRNRGWLFPNLGGERELLDLEVALVDIDISLQRYAEAERKLKTLEAPGRPLTDVTRAGLQLRWGQISILTFKDDAEDILSRALPPLQKAGDPLTLAETWFQLAKARQFSSKDDAALEAYDKAQELYTAKNDRYNLLRVYNNLGMIHQSKLDYVKARGFYELQQRIARELGDDLGLGRALVNLSLIARARGSPA